MTRLLACVFVAAIFTAIIGCANTPVQEASVPGTRDLWISLSAEGAAPSTIVEILIDGTMVSNAENLQEFTTPSNSFQVGYFPLSGGTHSVEAISPGYTTFKRTILILPGGEKGAQNLHIHLQPSR